MPESFAAFQIIDVQWKLARAREPGVGPCPDIRVGITRASITCGKCGLTWRSREGERVGDFQQAGRAIQIQCPGCHAVGRVNLADVMADE